MNKTRLVVLVCVLAAFAAGVAAGVAASAAVGRWAGGPPRGSWIAHELDLTPEQRDQMHQIWSGVMSSLRQQQGDQRRLMREERDEAVRGLLNEGQKAEYAQIMESYAAKTAAMEEARRKAFEDATQRTKQILTESQRKEYERILQQREGWRRRRGPAGAGGGDRDPKAPGRGEE